MPCRAGRPVWPSIRRGKVQRWARELAKGVRLSPPGHRLRRGWPSSVEHLDPVVRRLRSCSRPRTPRAVFHHTIGTSERRDAGLVAMLGEATTAAAIGGCTAGCGAVSLYAGGATAMAKHATTKTAAGSIIMQDRELVNEVRGGLTISSSSISYTNSYIFFLFYYIILCKSTTRDSLYYS